MAERTVTTLDGRSTKIDQSAVDALAAQLTGDLLTPESGDYNEARTLWNAMIDRRPALIVECVSAADVAPAISFAREHGVLLSVCGAGHSIAGNAMAEGGLSISFKKMRGVEVDPASGTVRVEPGATLGDLDAATQVHGLAVPTGINSTTGIAGLTLGGGFGWLSRKYGMTVDNLAGVDVVRADGETLRASESQNAELFWGLRGGGGNFGVVTSFEFRAHPVGPEVLAGLIVHSFSDAEAVLRAYREFASTAPDEVTVWVVMRKAPPLPFLFLPAEVHGTEVVVLAAMYAGDIEEGEEALAPIRAAGNPIADVIGPTPFVGWQQAFDPLLTPGARNYWKTHDFAMNVHGRWESAGEDESMTGWCRELFDATAPCATGEAYVNFMTEEAAGRVSSAYGSSYERLVALKDEYDPNNLFRMNQNIPLSGA